ncbi:MAG: phosphatase PAP2 family protein [Muribaculaceae bacterium]|nr:phosphatase PAP2 family protein [Muribaculaceae bacterium]
MKLDTSSYYPRSPLDDDDSGHEAYMPGNTAGAESPEAATSEVNPEACPREKHEENDSIRQEEPTSHEPDLPPTELEAAATGLAHLLSWVLVPLLMPVYGVMLAFGLSILSFTDFGVRLSFTAIVTAINVAVPAAIVLLLKRVGLVDDLGLNGQKERFIPYVVSIMCLVGTALFMHFKGAPEWLVMFFFGGAAAGIVEVIVNRWWKISVHAAGIAGVVAMLLRMTESGDYMSAAIQTWLIITVAMAGLLGSARIWLGRHTLMQVLAGYAVGFCGVYFMMSF